MREYLQQLLNGRFFLLQRLLRLMEDREEEKLGLLVRVDPLLII